MVYPYLSYESILTMKHLCLKLLDFRTTLAIRIINDVSLREHITSQYAQLGVLKFPTLFSCLLVIFCIDPFVTLNSQILILAMFMSNMTIIPEMPSSNI